MSENDTPKKKRVSNVDKVNEIADKTKKVGNSIMAIGCLLTMLSVIVFIVIAMLL